MYRSVPLICIVGVSGVGKTTIARESFLSEVVSHTSRPIRDGEIPGLDYHFHTDDEMRMMRRNGIFTFDFKEFNNACYAASDLDLAGKDCIVIRIQDAYELRNKGLDIRIVEIVGALKATRSDRNIEDEKLMLSTYENEIDMNILNREGDLIQVVNILQDYYLKLKREEKWRYIYDSQR